MGIRDWHPGQLVVFVVGAGYVGWFLLALLLNPRIRADVVQFFTIASVVVIPVLVVSWKWFSGRSVR